ncbi:hypothetical protein GGQ99_003834 [Aminobacter niigataensis]|uniref:Uncharacterized protein n=1 Tax=Aminobacter niigataensis TaxID=83265 RepID=A0ABR6L5H2_9HYPH|nr:hypothetical protein [Aminobacter niigataensis]
MMRLVHRRLQGYTEKDAVSYVVCKLDQPVARSGEDVELLEAGDTKLQRKGPSP